jgi:hypothetical protein
MSISLLSSPPSSLSDIKCIAYNFDGSNVDRKDFSKLKYENGEEIPNVKDYLKER